MAANIIFIAALERSGSTIIDLTLGAHKDVVSFGEVERVIKPHGSDLTSVLERPCNCGKLVRNCPFWSEVIKKIIATPNEISLKQRYKHFLDTLEEQYGKDIFGIDSSKNTRALDALHNAAEGNIHVLHVVRDVRAWAYSIERANYGKDEMPWSKIATNDFIFHWKAFIRHRILREVPGWLMNEWAIRNNSIVRSMSIGIKWKRVSYEEFVLRPSKTLSLISDFLGIGSFDSQLDFSAMNSHIVRGNRTAFKKNLSFPLPYDYEWFTSYKYTAYYFLMPYLQHLNNTWVYENIRSESNE